MSKFFGSKSNPKGPYFKNARELSFDFSGNKLSFFTPKHTVKSYQGKSGKFKFNLFNEKEYTISKPPRAINERKELSIGYKEDWAFYGLPLLDGYLGRLGFSISVIPATTDQTLFDKSIFENIILKRIDDLYGPFSQEEVWRNMERFRTPLNWGSKSICGIEWLHYDMNELNRGKEIKRIYTTPITSNHYLRLNFSLHEHMKEHYCHEAFNNLIENILNSVTLTLSPSSQKEANEEADNKNQTYSKNIQPFEWAEFDNLKAPETPYEEYNRSKKEKLDSLGNIEA